MSKNFEFDKSGYNYAMRNCCRAVFADVNTGVIWQFFTNRKQSKETKMRAESLKGYPHMMSCELMDIEQYKEWALKKVSKKYDTGRH